MENPLAHPAVSVDYQRDLALLMDKTGAEWFKTCSKPKPTEKELGELREMCSKAYQSYLSVLYSLIGSINIPRKTRRALQSAYDKAKNHKIVLDLTWPNGERSIVDVSGNVRQPTDEDG